MQTLLKNKGILAAVAIFIVAMFVYNLFKSDIEPLPPELSASRVGDDLLKLRGELERVTLDQSLFSSPSYLLLTDFGTNITPQPTGRPNPFDIIGRD